MQRVLICADELCRRGGGLFHDHSFRGISNPITVLLPCPPGTLSCPACPALPPLQTPQQAEALVAEVAAVSDQLMSRCSWGALVARKLGLEAYQRRWVGGGVVCVGRVACGNGYGSVKRRTSAGGCLCVCGCEFVEGGRWLVGFGYGQEWRGFVWGSGVEAYQRRWGGVCGGGRGCGRGVVWVRTGGVGYGPGVQAY